MQRALVTGASGFCGSHLLDLLDADGIEVHTMGRSPAGQRYHVCDLFNREAVRKTVADVRPDWVFHLAGAAVASDGEELYSVNVVPAVNLLGAIGAVHPQAACLLVGTAAEYGIVQAADVPVAEGRAPNPVTHYGASKLAQTVAARQFSREGCRVVVARPSNIIGPGMPAWLALGQFVARINDLVRNGGSELVTGDLGSVRDLIDVRDAMGLFWRLIRCEGAAGQIVNVCSGVGTTMRALVGVLMQAVEAKHPRLGLSFKEQASARLGETPIFVGDPRKLVGLVGALSLRSLEDTVRDVVLADLTA